MCHTDSDFPVLGPAITTASGSELTLTAADGGVSRAFLAVPAKPSGAGVVVLPDNRGLHHFYEELACSLAEQGHFAVAIDYFGRTAGAAPRDESFQPQEHLPKVTRGTIDADLAAATKVLTDSAGTALKSLFTIGFCFGGRHSFLSSAPQYGTAGVIGFYGFPGSWPNGALGPTARVAELGAPVLGFFGGADQGIPASDVSAFDEALAGAKIPHDIVTYPGAPHSFFDRHLTEYAGAAQDAWARSLAFIGSHASA